MHKSIATFSTKLRQAIWNGSSINNPKLRLWTLENFTHLHQALNNNLKEENDSFLNKISQQFEEAKTTIPDLRDKQQEALLPLVFELLSVYYVFPSNISVSTKENALKKLLDADNSIAKKLKLSIDDFSISRDALKAGGIGSGGMGYNTNKQKEFFYLVDVCKAFYESHNDAQKTLDYTKEDRIGFQNFLDAVAGDRNPQLRHILLHLFFPKYYEPISSSSQKWQIIQVFSAFCDEEKLQNELDGTEPTNSTDQKIKVIANKLKKLRGKDTNFYDDELLLFWNAGSSELFEDLDVELLDYKKQVVLYGPPGTSKTYTAKKLAAEMIRYRIAKDLGIKIFESDGQQKLNQALENNIHPLQLHPAYSYEDFIQGLQFKDGNTSYKPGYLLRLLEKMKEDKSAPYVLILDEVNRVDLSRLFGECFSALENRGEAIDLLGSSDTKASKLTIPDNLYIIGTMNLIDHSVEQIDFALRRRFLWVETGYQSDALLVICKSKWDDLKWSNKTFTWDKVESDFKRMVNAANKLNKAISDNAELGKDFELGHVFFAEAVPFLHQFLEKNLTSQTFLFANKGTWREPIDKLWRLSLSPLLREYLSGLDNKEQTRILKGLKDSFKP